MTTKQTILSPFNLFLIVLLVINSIHQPAVAQKIDIPTIPVSELSIDSDFSHLAPVLGNQIQDSVTLVGLGEFSHGSYEDRLFKIKMLQYLILRRGYRQLLFEGGNAALVTINQYIHNRADTTTLNAGAILITTFGNYTDKTLIKLIVWLKRYNLSHPSDEVSINGIDTEGGIGPFVNYFLYNFLVEFDPTTVLEIQQSDYNDTQAIAPKLLKWYDIHAKQLQKQISVSAYAELVYNIRAVRLALEFAALKKVNVYRAAKFRDSVMAENVKYLMPGQKCIIWAHNAHITFSDNLPCMGNYLKRSVGGRYYSILTEFADKASVRIFKENGQSFIETIKANSKTIGSQVQKHLNGNVGVVIFSLQPELSKINLINGIDRDGNYGTFGRGIVIADALCVFDKVSPLGY